ncbi:hypothetical protein B6U99_03200 [Candidatus Geothermarchaeota archaeon ex4572_27]|nr:MAG: hypothetical protein B6U99_03200 [Candidatus Geothermarchaeota archaeon ex4572_27]
MNTWLGELVKGLAPNVLLASVVGSRLYGYAAEGSDYDVLGCFAHPTRELLRLRKPGDTITYRDEIVDATLHEVEKFLRLMLKPNGNVVEAALSPLTLVSSRWVSELRSLAEKCVCRRLYMHYRGYATEILKRLDRRFDRKSVLSLYRTILTGIHVLETGRYLFSLNALCEKYGVKIADSPDEVVEDARKLLEMLDEAYRRSNLPERPECEEEADSLLLRIRLYQGSRACQG